MSSLLFRARLGRYCFFAGWVVLTTVHGGVAQADNSVASQSTVAARDFELPPLMAAKSERPRYAGWLLSAYLVPPVVAASGVVAESSGLLIASAASFWLLPTAVHLFAGENASAARGALVLAFAAGGALGGGLIGLGIAALAGQGQADREESPGVHHVVGLLRGAILGTGVGALTWAFIDISDTFERDGSHTSRAGTRVARSPSERF